MYFSDYILDRDYDYYLNQRARNLIRKDNVITALMVQFRSM